MRRFLWIVLLCGFAQLTASCLSGSEQQRSAVKTVNASELPKEARRTVALIKQGGPYPYQKDGSVFGNYEKALPLHEHGYYREFTVPNRDGHDRGARRIVLGKAGELYYTDDHYATFRRVRE